MSEKTPIRVEEELFDKLKQQLGLSAPPTAVKERIPTGIPPLDHILGGGIPVTAFSIFFGPESSGKTTVAAHVAAHFQRKYPHNGIVVWVDNEYSFSQQYFSQLGVVQDKVLYRSGLTIEEVFTLMEKIVAASLSKEYKDFKFLFVWDSIAATPTDMEDSATFDQMLPGAGARVLSSGFRKLSKTLTQHPPIAFLIINQVRESFNTPGWGDSTEMYGGWALRHYSALFVRFTKKRVIQDEARILTKVRIEKSKVYGAPLFASTELVVQYGKGVDVGATLLHHAKSVGVVGVKGGWYSWSGKNWRKDQLEELFRKEPEKVWKEILEATMGR